MTSRGNSSCIKGNEFGQIVEGGQSQNPNGNKWLKLLYAGSYMDQGSIQTKS